jgi:hypothetical protein
VRQRIARTIVLLTVISGGGVVIGRLLGYRFGGHTIVRCHSGHLFSTVWIPGVKLKAIDLGVARIQRCPVGRHITLVTPVRHGTLSPEDEASARAVHDGWIP